MCKKLHKIENLNEVFDSNDLIDFTDSVPNGQEGAEINLHPPDSFTILLDS